MVEAGGTGAGRPGRERAVVIGGGYAGLLAARVLSDHFAEVLVLERDAVSRETGAHPSAPQSYHAHAMLAKGGETLEKLFPGLRAELEQIGSPVFDYGERISFLLPSGYATRTTTGVHIQTFTRDELERRLRGRVLDLAPVRMVGGARCRGLLTAPGERNGRAVTGVRYRIGDGAEEEVAADLVVDASGRSGAIDDWLIEAGLPVSAKSTVRARITYTTMVFDRTGEQDYDVAYQMTFAPSVRRGGVMMGIEHGRWVCSLFGFEQHPPTDTDAYLEFARDLDNPRLAEEIARRSRQEEVHRYTNPGSTWRLHHRNPGWPDRLVAIGDALCVFNPVYGQGLTVAAIEADALGTLLRRRSADADLTGLSRDYLRAAAGIVKAPWTLSTTSDLMWSPEGQPLGARFAHWFNRHVFALALHDADVWTRFVKVANMTAPPSLLMHPSVLAKVVRRAVTRQPAPTPVPAA
ncbi:FAD-dependent oxidoreductase [Kitasatospora sp. NPDC101183]|uniref:FAD-dependent oxidoreductase n=1 Tax=Kitasatospora sp. NPDC101183 TaxID=3364100 RepID=UPI003820D763